MNRRSFLKLSVLFAGAMAVETNPLLHAASKLAESNPVSVLIYKIYDRKKKRWTIKGTKYKDLDKTNFSRQKWLYDSFKVLAIVDNSEAEMTRRRLWKEEGITHRYPDGFPLDVVRAKQVSKFSNNKELGKNWKRKLESNDPEVQAFVKAHYAHMQAQAMKTRREFPELEAARVEAAAEGIREWTKELRSNPEEYRKYIEARTASHLEWCAQNPEKLSEIGKKRAKLSQEWFKVPENLEASLPRLSDAGKIGGKESIRRRKENGTFEAMILKAAFAGGAAISAKAQKQVDMLHQACPAEFTRKSIYALAKQIGVPAHAATKIMDDESLSVRAERIPRGKGNGRGGRVMIWHKV